MFLVYVYAVFTFSFCYCFDEGFIRKIILIRQFLSFICISYPRKVFKFDTGFPRDSCEVPLLKTLSSLPQSIAYLCLILFLMFGCNILPFRAFVAMIYWASTEVLLNLVDPLDSAAPSLDFEPIFFFFELPVLIPLVLYLIWSVSAKIVFLALDMGVLFSDFERINIWFH